MVGGVLVERTVKDILPALEHNFEQVCVLLLTSECELLSQNCSFLDDCVDKETDGAINREGKRSERIQRKAWH